MLTRSKARQKALNTARSAEKRSRHERHLENLPNRALIHIFYHLTFDEVENCRKASKKLKERLDPIRHLLPRIRLNYVYVDMGQVYTDFLIKPLPLTKELNDDISRRALVSRCLLNCNMNWAPLLESPIQCIRLNIIDEYSQPEKVRKLVEKNPRCAEFLLYVIAEKQLREIEMERWDRLLEWVIDSRIASVYANVQFRRPGDKENQDPYPHYREIPEVPYFRQFSINRPERMRRVRGNRLVIR